MARPRTQPKPEAAPKPEPKQEQPKPEPKQPKAPKAEPSEKVVHSEAKNRVDRPVVADDDGPGFESEDSPSALALDKVGEDGDGEKYLIEKKKHRWG